MARQRFKLESDNIRVPAAVDPETMTHQEFKDECDIRNIHLKYRETGIVSHVNLQVGRFGDWSQSDTFHQAASYVAGVTSWFSEQPAELRDRFRNDPAELLAWLEDVKNTKEACDLGLLPESERPAEPPTAPAESPGGVEDVPGDVPAPEPEPSPGA